MPASISLHDLSYSTPDGTSLFDRLSVTFGPGRTGLVGRNGTGKSTILRLITGDLQPASGSIMVAGSIGVLEQSTLPPAGETVAGHLGVADALARLDRLDQGLGTLDDAAEADWALPTRIESALATTGLPALDPARPLTTLSGGQRTRIALARLVLAEPDIILLDEPTNNLDADGRTAVADLLRAWRGMAIVVSHDRDLLDTMDAIVELTTLGARSYGGNYTHYRAQKDLELAAAATTLARTERQVVELDRRIQQQAERKAKKDAVGTRKAARGDIPRILLGGMKENAENSSGENARLATRQRSAAADAAAEARAQVEVLTPLSVRLEPTGLPAGKTVLQATALTGGPDHDHPVIRDFHLTITGPERISVTGPNGSGKTSLLRLLTGALPASSGTVHCHVPFAMLDQSISILDPSLSIRDNFARLNPDADANTVRAALARFMFRADAALQVVGTLSGGETLRAGLAATIGGQHPPQLLILDEPTNHLDIHAIEELEAGLSAYDGALLVVSHDRAFLDRIGISRAVTLGSGPT